MSLLSSWRRALFAPGSAYDCLSETTAPVDLLGAGLVGAFGLTRYWSVDRAALELAGLRSNKSFTTAFLEIFSLLL